MKKFTKVMLIIAAVFAVLGICFSAAGASLGATLEGVKFVQNLKERFGDGFMEHVYFDDDDDDDHWETDWEEYLEAQKDDGKGNRSYELSAVKSLDLELRYDEVRFQSCTGNKILVEIANDPDNNVRVHSDGEEIEIRSIKRKNNRKITISIPDKTEFENLEIDLDAGIITIDHNLQAGSLGISVGAGELVANSTMSAREAEIEVGAGSVMIKNLDADSVQGECGVGEMNITLQGKKEDYQYHTECGVGTLMVGDDDFSGVSGEHEYHPQGAERTLELECGMGELKVSFNGQKI